MTREELNKILDPNYSAMQQLEDIITKEKSEKQMQEIMSTAESLQDECQKVCEYMVLINPKLEYQDCVNVWLFKKLAELQLLKK